MAIQPDPNWEAMFDIQYALCEEVEEVFQRHAKGLPDDWKAAARAYVIEQFGERIRMDMELSDRKPKAVPAPAHQGTADTETEA